MVLNFIEAQWRSAKTRNISSPLLHYQYRGLYLTTQGGDQMREVLSEYLPCTGKGHIQTGTAAMPATVVPMMGEDQRCHKQSLDKGQSKSQGLDQGHTIEFMDGSLWFEGSGSADSSFKCSRLCAYKASLTEQSTWSTGHPALNSCQACERLEPFELKWGGSSNCLNLN